MAGVAAHSEFRDDPWGRLVRTAQYVGTVTYGTTAEAKRAAARVRGLHRTVQRHRPGERSSLQRQRSRAADLGARHRGRLVPDDGAARRLALTDAEADGYVAEQAAGRSAARGAGGARAAHRSPRSTTTTRGCVRSCEVGAQAREAARFVMHPPMPPQGRPADPGPPGLVRPRRRWPSRCCRAGRAGCTGCPGLPTTDLGGDACRAGAARRAHAAAAGAARRPGPHRRQAAARPGLSRLTASALAVARRGAPDDVALVVDLDQVAQGRRGGAACGGAVAGGAATTTARARPTTSSDRHRRSAAPGRPDRRRGWGRRYRSGRRCPPAISSARPARRCRRRCAGSAACAEPSASGERARESSCSPRRACRRPARRTCRPCRAVTTAAPAALPDQRASRLRSAVAAMSAVGSAAKYVPFGMTASSRAASTCGSPPRPGRRRPGSSPAPPPPDASDGAAADAGPTARARASAAAAQRRPTQGQRTGASQVTARMTHERRDRVGDQLDRDRRQQQPENARQHRDSRVLDQPDEQHREAQRRVQHEMHGERRRR